MSVISEEMVGEFKLLNLNHTIVSGKMIIIND